MKPIFSSDDLNEINAMKLRMETHGIPVFIKNEHTGRNLHILGDYAKQALCVLLEDQLDDALALVENENHVVEHPVDVADFYAELEESNHTTRHRLTGMATIALIVTVLVFVMIVLITS